MQYDANNSIPYFRKTQNMQLSRFFLDFCNTNTYTKTLIRYLFKLVFDQKNTKEVD